VRPLTKGTLALATVMFAAATVAAYKPTKGVQKGYPGVGMETLQTQAQLDERVKANTVPFALPAADKSGPRAVDAYENVQVLGHLSSAQVTRLMASITIWVAPDAGCGYCHAPQRDDKGNIVRNDLGYAQADPNKMASDELYTKRVARRMLQMTMRINGDWQQHVKATGVTCWTCHRGNAVPTNIWFDVPESPTNDLTMGGKAGQNAPATVAGLTSLPGNSLRPFLAGDENIRIQSMDPLPADNRASIKQTEWTYALMVHISNSLGVNCTYCHNTRSMGEWQTSPPTRTTAWYGIRMVRELNKEYLEPLTSSFPPNRLGVLGDGPKVNCATCHQGAYKPLLGVSMLGDFQELAKVVPQPAKTVVVDAGVPLEGDASVTPTIGDAGAIPLTDGGATNKDAGAKPASSDGGDKDAAKP
jgi:photosynthetic reaction center cytochrome c subunit